METDRLLAPSKEVQKAVEGLWTMIHRVGDSLAAKQDSDAEYQTRIAYLESEIEAKSAAMAVQASTMETWKEEIATIDELRASMKGLYEKLNDMQSLLQHKDDEIKHLNTSLSSQLDASESLRQSGETIHLLQAQLREWQEKATSLEKDLDDGNGKLNQAFEQLAGLQTELRQEKQLSQQAEATLMSVEQELEKAQAHASRQHDAALEYKSQLDEMTTRMYETEKQLILAEDQLRLQRDTGVEKNSSPTLIEGMLTAELETHKARIAQLEMQVQSMSAHHNDVSTDGGNGSATQTQRSHLAESLRTTADYLAKSESVSTLQSDADPDISERAQNIARSVRDIAALLERSLRDSAS